MCIRDSQRRVHGHRTVDLKLYLLNHLEHPHMLFVEVFYKERHEDDDSKLLPVEGVTDFVRMEEGYKHVQWPAKKGTYVIYVHNVVEKVEKYDYSINVNSHEITTLRHGEYTRDLVKKGEKAVYEILASEKGLLGIEVHECAGSVVLHYARKYSDLLAGNYSATEPHASTGIQYHTTNYLAHGVRYVVVSVAEGIKLSDGAEYAQFKIQALYYKEDDNDWRRFVHPGDEGNTVWTQSGFGKFDITYDRVEYYDDYSDETDDLENDDEDDFDDYEDDDEDAGAAKEKNDDNNDNDDDDEDTKSQKDPFYEDMEKDDDDEDTDAAAEDDNDDDDDEDTKSQKDPFYEDMEKDDEDTDCLLYTSPSPRDQA
eukprot:TRINITY_DN5353_c0_g1_i1.p1 TRINITY_DN5353_c0_g1~~TRINITY_DN5353_c0_g1_i1.p1  ORF type:complete len:368 (+),score=116.25 TRINITY_DN5353_c0_g1_i1:65-1168(+)